LPYWGLTYMVFLKINYRIKIFTKVKVILSYILIFSAYHLGLAQVNNVAFYNMLDDLLSHTVPEVKAKDIESDAGILFLDARAVEEYQVSHLPNAKHVGYENFKAKNVKDIPKEQQIVVYCTVGYRSEKIAEKLQKLGFTNVSNLYGGIFEWVHANKALMHKDTLTTKVHTYNHDWSQWLLKGEKIYFTD